VGEWATATLGVGRGDRFELIHEIRFPHSLGLLYSAFTYYLGFKVNSAEYKVMGAAPYGDPKHVDTILEHLIDLREDGSFKLDMKYFAYDYGLTMTNRRFEKLFGVPRRDPEGPMEQFHWDMAASIQKVTEEIVLRMARDLHARTGMKNLCMAGGVALNCVANGRLIREGPFENLWVQPAAGDAGGALGAAMFVDNCVLDRPRRFRMDHAYWGPAFSDEEIRRFLDGRKAPYRTLPRDEMIHETARLLDQEQAVVGWFQGRMEWGPRSLGSRSILADARNEENWKRVNLKIKFRESFRPFAPACLEEKAGAWFDIDRESPYMLLVCQVREDAGIPAVTHVDGSARLQTVKRDPHPEFYDLIQAFDERTGCPVLINTSFNVRGEPIVCTPEDAYLCFMRTNMDVLVLGNQLLRKEEQPELVEDFDWRERYELD
jgi:carbamoyltransferase